jgi:ATP-binding cassette subfamily C protein LapB
VYAKESLLAGLPFEPGQPLSVELLQRVAHRAHLNIAFKSVGLEAIPSLVLPCVLVLKNRQACLLESVDAQNNKANIRYPENPDGVKEVSLESLQTLYLGQAIYLSQESTQTYQQETLHKSRDKHWFWGTLWDNKTIYRDVLIASFFINLFVLANPLFVMNVYDRIVPNNAVESLWVLAVGISVVYLFDLLLKYLRHYFIEMANKKNDVIMSSRLFEQTLDLKMSSRTESIGILANTLKEFDNIKNFFSAATIASFVDLPFVVVFLIVIFYIGGVLVLIPLGIILVILIYSMLMVKPIHKSVEATYAAGAEKNAMLIESLSLMETIKSLGLESRTQWHWEQTVGEIARTSLKSKMLQSAIGRFTGFVQQMSTVMVVVGGVYLISDNLMTMGALIATVMLSQRAINPIGQIANLIASYQQSKATLENLNQIMDKPVERANKKHFIEPKQLQGNIEFIDVCFTYPGQSKAALKNVSFSIKAGERVGLIGRIGSGKSTIEKLILGFYQPDSGSILIDGIDINQIDPAHLRKNINYVSQDVKLFKGSVKDNILARAPYLDDTSLLKAAHLSGVDDFIKIHPQGYGLQIEDGGESLSGGQRQSIGLARAFVMESPIYLFDEPTNAMDAKTEQLLIKRLKSFELTRTLLISTHKMSLITLVDRLIVLEDNSILLDGEKNSVLEQLKNSQGA